MDLRRRLATLILVRLAVSTVLLGSAIVIQISNPGVLPVDPFFFLIGLTYALSVVYLATLRFTDRHRWLIDAQLGCDAILVSAFISVTGGVTSYFSSLYVLPIIAASTLSFRRGAVQVAGLSAILYLGLVSAQYLAASGELMLPWPFASEGGVVLPPLRYAQYTVGINLFGFVAVALLSGSLAEGVRTAGVRLERASTQMADLRAFNQHVIDSLLSGLITTDERGRVLTFNRAAETISGIPASGAIGQDVTDLFQLDATMRERFRQPGPTPLRVDLAYHTPDDRTIDIGFTTSSIVFPDARRGVLVTFQDVTAVRRLERNARLQQRLAAVGEMAAGIAHEIRNPLAAMSGSIQVLRQELPLSEEQAQLMDIVLRESERLNDTIRSFLAYARPQRFAVARLDVRTILQDTALLLRNGSDVRDHHIVEVDVPPDPIWFDADENQLRQILWNLATNGLRAMPNGGRLLVAIAQEAHTGTDGHIVLTVEDEGIGIPPEDIETIFQPFHSSFDKGTGLGLAIVHRVVTDYGGTIQVSSTPNSGTTIRVRMPVRLEREPARLDPVRAGGAAAL
jgi:two-component system sensor histidine kinase PilS (NtrC family)